MSFRVCLAALALAGVALAEESTDAGTAEKKTRAVVHLKDGSLMRGTVKRMRLGKSITLSLSSGKTVTFDEPEIVTIEILGGAAQADDGAFAEQSVTAAAPAKPAAGAKTPEAAPTRPPPLQAAPVSDLDTVYLNDGGLLRGYIESERPDVVIRLVSGRKRNLSPKDVKSIERHGAPRADKAKKP